MVGTASVDLSLACIPCMSRKTRKPRLVTARRGFLVPPLFGCVQTLCQSYRRYVCDLRGSVSALPTGRLVRFGVFYTPSRAAYEHISGRERAAPLPYIPLGLAPLKRRLRASHDRLRIIPLLAHRVKSVETPCEQFHSLTHGVNYVLRRNQRAGIVLTKCTILQTLSRSNGYPIEYRLPRSWRRHMVRT